jgi:pentatricopeptide repeat protein
MEMENLQTEINNMKLINNKSLEYYNSLLKKCIEYKEMRATVYVYDDMLENNIKPNDNTFKIIDKLHSKTVPEFSRIYIKNFNKNSLQPRRRIHKIMKGHNYSKNYNNALINLDKVKLYLDKNPEHKSVQNRHKLAIIIAKNCNVSINDSRYIITKLKRIKYLTDEPIKTKDIRNFFI